MTQVRYLTLLVLVFIAAGCSSSSEDPTRYYLIEPLIEPGAATGNSSSLAIAIADLDVPQYLERFQIASRRAENQLVFASSHQWAENLRKNLSRVLANNLSQALGTPDVGTPSNRSASNPDVRVSVYIERFERNANGYVSLNARWQLRRDKEIITHTSALTSDSRISATDFAGTVTQLSRLFGGLSAEIALAIRESQ